MRQLLLLSILFISSLLSQPAVAQTARKILDTTAQKLQTMPAAEAEFEIGTFDGTTPISETIQGKMLVQKDMLYMEADQMHMWYDGKTQWTLLKNSNEVNVSTPTPEEMQQMHPYSFINIYKKGFKLSVSDATYKEQSVYEIRMVPNSKKRYNDIHEIRITIDKKNYLPLSIRMRSDKNIWTRIRINNLKSKPAMNADIFRFNHKDYKDIEVIDLR